MRRNTFNSPRRFEKLEDRRLMAADAMLASGLLHITGTDNGDYITVSQSAPNQSSDIITVRIRDAANASAV